MDVQAETSETEAASDAGTAAEVQQPKVPWRPESFPFTEQSFLIALEVTKALADNPELYKVKEMRPLREALQPLFNMQRERMFGGTDPDTNGIKQMLKRRKAIERDKQRAEDKSFLEQTKLRAGRLNRLDNLSKQDALGADPGLSHLQLLIDGVADDGTAINAVVLPTDNSRKRMIEAVTMDDDDDGDDESSGAAGMTDDHQPTAATSTGADPQQTGTNEGRPERPKLLNKAIACYSCHRRFREIHHFYDKLCPACAELNFSKRIQTCDLTGRVLLVTGGRVKIGFQCCMKLLRCGATVIATSRFPVDTANRFAEQQDFAEWRACLHVVGLDFRNIPALERFCDMVLDRFPRLDAIINNACQTIRRPPVYYEHMVRAESRPLVEMDPALQQLLHCDYHVFRATFLPTLTDGNPPSSSSASFSSSSSSSFATVTAPSTITATATAATTSMPTAAGLDMRTVPSAQLSQVPLLLEDHSTAATAARDRALFPRGAVDVNNQQLDLRTHNSWLLRMHEVSTTELAEVMAINALAPFVLVARLKPLMMRGLGGGGAGQGNGAGAGVGGSGSGSGVGAAMPSMAAAILGQSVEREGGREATLRDAIRSGDSSYYGSAGSSAASSSSSSSSSSTSSSSSSSAGTGPGGKEGSEGGEGKDASSGAHGATGRRIAGTDARFVVNVSSMEGKFYRRKLVTHPHTNMAKAALNMMTRTSATDYQLAGIFMTCVDTGWINDENPLDRATKTAATNNFTTPLDEVDAAARILDPIIGPLKEAQELSADGTCSPPFGCFLKDFFVTEW